MNLNESRKLTRKLDFKNFSNYSIYPVFLLVVAMFCLSLNHVIGRGVHEEVPPIGLGFWRWLIAGLVFLPLIWKRRKTSFPIMKSSFKKLFLLAVLLTASSTSVLVALHFTSATNAALINATQPTITVCLAWLFLKQSIQFKQKVGIFLAFFGVIVMLSKGDLSSFLDMSLNAGDLIVICAMFGLATYSIKLRIVPEELTSIEVLFAILILGSIALFPIYLLETILYKPVPLSLNAFSSILAMAIFVIALGMLCWNIGIQLLGPSISSVFLNLIPVFGASLAIVFLGEQYYFYHFFCLLLVGVGMLLVLSEQIMGSKKTSVEEK